MNDLFAASVFGAAGLSRGIFIGQPGVVGQDLRLHGQQRLLHFGEGFRGAESGRARPFWRS